MVGVVGDFSGNPTQKLKPLTQRKFVQIDRDNFNEVMARMTPGASFRVENTLKDDGSELAVNLSFNSIEDFEPANVVKQVEPLQKLIETRNKLRDLMTKVDVSEDLESVLESVLENTDELEKFKNELGLSSDGRQSPDSSDEEE